MTAPTTPASGPLSAPATLRRLYLARFTFAIVWAVLLLASGPDIDPVTATLLVVYPLFDVAAAVVDLRSSRHSRSASGLYVNTVLSAATAVGLVVAAGSGIPAVLRVWGLWAVTAGVVQLVVALGRRGLAGQLPMVLSGGISVLAGAAFVAMAAGDDAKLSGIGGYAVLGGVFFLVSALRLNRAAADSQRA